MTDTGLDVTRAVATFLDNVGRFAQVALLTDAEVAELFGPETAAALARFDGHSRESGLCASCGGVCCREIGCEVYSPLFEECPIHETRPLLCRFHFCYGFDGFDRTSVIALRDVFLSCYTADQIANGSIARAMNVPPLESACPVLAANVEPVMDSVRAGRVSPGEGLRLIRAEVERYRRRLPHSPAQARRF